MQGPGSRALGHRQSQSPENPEARLQASTVLKAISQQRSSKNKRRELPCRNCPKPKPKKIPKPHEPQAPHAPHLVQHGLRCLVLLPASLFQLVRPEAPGRCALHLEPKLVFLGLCLAPVTQIYTQMDQKNPQLTSHGQEWKPSQQHPCRTLKEPLWNP